MIVSAETEEEGKGQAGWTDVIGFGEGSGRKGKAS